jgi:hypothetical protein
MLGLAPCFVIAAGACGDSADGDEPALADAGEKDGAPLFVPDGAADHSDGDTGSAEQCRVSESSGTAPDCTKKAPPDSFAPVLKWSWTIPNSGGFPGSLITPLVGNFTDDNNDGFIDLCDTPDVLVTGGGGSPDRPGRGKIYMLSGKTGELEVTFSPDVNANVTPAFGDIDGDGLPEVVSTNLKGQLVAYENDGTLKWTGDVADVIDGTASYCSALALYDLEGDGNVEILAAFDVFDHLGHRKFGVAGRNKEYTSASEWHFICPTPTAADLDGDGKLEVITGNVTFHADGSIYWTLPGPPGQPAVANLDADPEPEVLIAREDGLLVLEHDGTVKFGPLRLTYEGVDPLSWSKPPAIHDFDGDGIADIAAGTFTDYSVYKVNGDGLSILWSVTIDDGSGIASSTAFDFLGRGTANAIYGDQKSVYVFDGLTGKIQVEIPRTSSTLIEFPIVADVDNDSSADIVFVGSGPDHVVAVYEDKEKRWMPSRRIWNQHAYHVTNVLEDGRIPRNMPASWKSLNTFRTNSQRGQGGDCKPPVPNPPK